ncbi:4Fe-4S dicluster domain-containing protein [Asaccharospora irregularis]|nr:4Fe-4S dicluster domain-containing protein [Asaccharospora irregularis]
MGGERYDANAAKPSECEDCGLCETRCPYELPIRKMLKNVVEKLG